VPIQKPKSDCHATEARNDRKRKVNVAVDVYHMVMVYRLFGVTLNNLQAQFLAQFCHAEQREASSRNDSPLEDPSLRSG